MFDLFYIPKTGGPSIVSPGPWLSAKRQLIENTNKIINYYRHHPQVIPSSHLLVRLIYAMNVSKSIPLDRFYDYCKHRAYNTSQSIGLTSAISRGRVWDGVFYGSGSTEVIIVNDEYFDLEMSHQNWRSLQSVRVLQHNRSDLTFNIPDGKSTTPDYGISVLTVNVPMLMVQYYHFTKEQDMMEKTGAPRKSIMQFLYSYVLANMLYSHVDLALFNRMRNLQRNEPNSVSFLRHSFAMQSTTSQIDEAIKVAYKNILTRETDKLYEKFSNIPVAFAQNFSESLELPHTAPTMQVYWSLICARIKQLAFILRTYENPRRAVSTEISQVQKFLKMHGVCASIKSIVGKAAWPDIEGDVEFLTKL